MSSKLGKPLITITPYDLIYRQNWNTQQLGNKVGNKGKLFFLPDNFIIEESLSEIQHHLEKTYFQTPNTCT